MLSGGSDKVGGDGADVDAELAAQLAELEIEELEEQRAALRSQREAAEEAVELLREGLRARENALAALLRKERDIAARIALLAGKTNLGGGVCSGPAAAAAAFAGADALGAGTPLGVRIHSMSADSLTGPADTSAPAASGDEENPWEQSLDVIGVVRCNDCGMKLPWDASSVDRHSKVCRGRRQASSSR
eukprot:TRINITY_DN10092_c0_g1_i1.p2 TRINITY_DN10092_c0_g1~~TRINITY_DN10092_c0_g1_i1.p2  ORF type:complete len:189 (-),score=52.18 TRINITY_DN10092_c0_g1_i1:567-1133(-)